MKLVIQRVKEASVMVNGDICGKIGQGYLVLVGITDSNTEETADKMISKMIKLRIFEDENGKTNLDLPDDLEAFSLFPLGYPAEGHDQEKRFDESRIHYAQ